MKLIEAKCPKCKEIITVDGDSDSTKCDFCGEKIDVKEALVAKLMNESTDKPKKKTTKKIPKKEVKKEEVEEVEEEVEEIEEEEPEKEEEVIPEEPEEEESEEESEDEEESEEDEESEEESDEEEPEEKIKDDVESIKDATFDEVLSEAEKLWKDEKYAIAYDYYVKASKIKPKDKFCKFRVNLAYWGKDLFEKERLMKTYESLLDVDYCFDENGNKTDKVEILQKEFALFVYNQAQIESNKFKREVLNPTQNVKTTFNGWYSFLYMYELFYQEDVKNEVKEKIVLYILSLIDLLMGKYNTRDGKFEDLNNRESLLNKKEFYLQELNKINPSISYKDTVTKEIKKNTKEFVKKKGDFSYKLGYLHRYHPVLFFLLQIFVLLAVALFWTFIRDLISGNI